MKAPWKAPWKTSMEKPPCSLHRGYSWNSVMPYAQRRMKPEDFISKWSTEAEALQRRGAMVNGAALCAELLADFEVVMAAEGAAELNLKEAARESGYSAGYLGRLVRLGRIPNAGRPSAPRIRRNDLPRKVSSLPSPRSRATLLGATRGQIARSVVESEKGGPR